MRLLLICLVSWKRSNIHIGSRPTFSVNPSGPARAASAPWQVYPRPVSGSKPLKQDSVLLHLLQMIVGSGLPLSSSMLMMLQQMTAAKRLPNNAVAMSRKLVTVMKMHGMKMHGLHTEIVGEAILVLTHRLGNEPTRLIPRNGPTGILMSGSTTATRRTLRMMMRQSGTVKLTL